MEAIRTSCPACDKLYSVKTNLIRTARPHFKCLDCQTQFYFDLPPSGSGDVVAPSEFAPAQIASAPSRQHSSTANDDEAGLDRDDHGAPPPNKKCAKCGSMNPAASQECRGCGVLMDKYILWKKGRESWAHANPRVQKAWQDVLASYDEPSAHSHFVDRCQAMNELPAAARCYQQILEANPSDETAQTMKRQIAEIVALSLSRKEGKADGTWGTLSFSLALMLGAVLATVGFCLEGAHNLIGVGISLILTAIGARFYYKQILLAIVALGLRPPIVHAEFEEKDPAVSNLLWVVHCEGDLQTAKIVDFLKARETQAPFCVTIKAPLFNPLAVFPPDVQAKPWEKSSRIQLLVEAGPGKPSAEPWDLEVEIERQLPSCQRCETECRSAGQVVTSSIKKKLQFSRPNVRRALIDVTREIKNWRFLEIKIRAKVDSNLSTLNDSLVVRGWPWCRAEDATNSPAELGRAGDSLPAFVASDLSRASQ